MQRLPLTSRLLVVLQQSEQARPLLQGALSFLDTTVGMSDRALSVLLSSLSAGNMPAEVLRIVKTMQGDERSMPSIEPDSRGRSFITSWLSTRHHSAAAPGFEGLLLALPALCDTALGNCFTFPCSF